VRDGWALNHGPASTCFSRNIYVNRGSLNEKLFLQFLSIASLLPWVEVSDDQAPVRKFSNVRTLSLFSRSS
jgi:hypothetical protein